MSWSRVGLYIHAGLLLVAEAAVEGQGATTKVTSFQSFTAMFGRDYEGGLLEYQDRQRLFESRAAKVFAQNRKRNRRWTAAINAFSDRTAAELMPLRGWRRRGSPAERGRHGDSKSVSLSQVALSATPRSELPKAVSWAFLNSTQRHHNQGSCGSCWAIASSVLLEAHSEIHSADGNGRSFSAQELISCVPNPEHCGGTGGCEGATIELAMDWVIKNGLAADSEVPYKAVDGECRVTKQSEGSSLLQLLDRGSIRSVVPQEDGPGTELVSSSPGARVGMLGWERLPENKYDDLLRAVQDGPVGISIAASDWFEYSEGIFDKCDKDAVIDHAVVLIGYGQDSSSGEGYWLLKNSWGMFWGEQGNIRVLRRGEAVGSTEEDEGSWCGVDRQPEVGSGCDGGPSEVKVCGTCGILYDTVVPHWRGSSEKAKKRALTTQ